MIKYEYLAWLQEAKVIERRERDERSRRSSAKTTGAPMPDVSWRGVLNKSKGD